jgi:dihydroorotase
VAEAKRRGVRVTAEVTPHHLTLTHEDVRGYNTQAKMNPPLRTDRDVRALRAALASGTIDMVATDHAPHHYDEKEREFDFAPFGILGLETAFGLLHTELVLGEGLPLAALVERMSTAPARIFHLPGGTLALGSTADVTVLDLEERWTVNPEVFLSKSRNSPFTGRRLTGRPWATIVAGRLGWSAGPSEEPKASERRARQTTVQPRADTTPRRAPARAVSRETRRLR